MDARNQEYEDDQRSAYEVHINNNTIRKESQSPIREVLARSCWRAGPGQEASDGSKVRREGKAGPFIPCEVRAQTGSARATTPVVARRRRRATIAVSAWAKAYLLGRRRLRPGDNASARATTFAAWEGCFFTNTPNFSARATTSASERLRLHMGDYIRARATTFGACIHDQGWFCPSKLQIWQERFFEKIAMEKILVFTSQKNMKYKEV